MKINIADAPMGAGKTSAAINYINGTDDNTKVLYITPYLTEVERIINECPSKNFQQPKVYGSKLKGIEYLFSKGINIVSTHALFSSFTIDTIELIKQYNYTLIMDEVADVAGILPIDRYDLENILDNYTTIENGRLLKWHKKDYHGCFSDYKRLCDLGCVGVSSDKKVILRLFPISIFKAFKSIYILTYLFKAQVQSYYFDFHGLEYEQVYIAGDNAFNYRFTKDVVVYNEYDYSKLIHICEDKQLNAIGSKRHSLTKGWYENKKNIVLVDTLKKNCINYFKHKTGNGTKFNLWTTFKDYKTSISGKGYTKGFLSSNVRATNEHKHKTTLAYLVNKYMNPYVKNFFLANQIKVDEDLYALSEMLQWIWRSAIRDGKEIYIYVPSKRMRLLLKDWIDSNSKK